MTRRRQKQAKYVRWARSLRSLASSLAVLAAVRPPSKKSASDEPPGSLGLPFIGETLAYARNAHRFFEERAARYGQVFKTRILGRNIVAFVGPDAFTFFADNPHFDRQGGGPPHIDKLLCRESLPLIDGPDHEQMRKLVLQSFTVEAVTGYLPVIQSIAEEYAERWARLGSFAWVDEYKRFSVSVCSALVLGDQLRPEEADDLVPVLDGLLGGLSAIPVSLPWTKYGRALRSRDTLLSLIDQAIGRAGSDSPSITMLSRMVNASDATGASLAPEQTRAQSVHMFFAAYGGIFRVLSLLSMDLALFPEIMGRAREEVRSAAPSGDIRLDALMRLPFLENVTFEVRRHNRIFASTFFDRITAPVSYGGYEFPAGWRAAGAIYTTMQDASVFTAPAEFAPDRFAPERAEHLQQQNAYVPQGGGSNMGHRCPAEDLTTHIMKLVAAVLLRSYTWELLPQDLSLDDQPSPLPKDGIQVSFQPKSHG